jgi:DNA polymerase III psi subunit
MLDTRRRQYLEAMGISTWSPREVGQVAAQRPVAVEQPAAGEIPVEEAMGSELTPRASALAVVEAPAPTAKAPAVEVPQAAVGVKLGPGRDGILLVCASADEPASRLANDIARALGAVPVWAWPEADDEALSIESAVEENLFTEIAVFGDDLAAALFSGEVPDKVGSASVVQLPSMTAVRGQATSRRALWNALCRAGMVNPERQ